MDVFDLVAKIRLDDSEYRDGVGKAKGTFSTLASGVGKGLATVAKVGAAAVSAGVAGVAALTKMGVEGYAQYEQLAGGAELLWGNAYSFIADKAKGAYAAVQMSQNDYLSQVNGFAVGLKTALGGNEQAAAELADRIITAEADIVAATGATQENVQNAFNGIMKNNFSMVDNLGLGITATKEGFQTMIDSVNAYNKAHGESTNYQIDNVADCQAALLDYIEMQGMSGYAANEAAGTIEGSLAMMKAAWQNLVVGVADSNADLGVLINNFVGSVEIAAKQLLPKIEQALQGIGQLITAMAPVIAEALPVLVESLLPAIITAGISLITALAGAIVQALPAIKTALEEGLVIILTQVFGVSEEKARGFTKGLNSAFSEIAAGFRAMVESAQTDGTWLNEIWTGLQNAGKLFVDFCVALWDTLSTAFAWCVEQVNTEGTVLNAIWESIKTFISAAVSVIQGVITAFTAVLRGDWSTAWESCKKIANTIWNAITTIISNMVSSISGFLGTMVEKGFELINSLAQGIANKFAELLTLVGGWVTDNIINPIADMGTDLYNAGVDLLNEFWDGLKSVWDSVKAWWDGLTFSKKSAPIDTDGTPHATGLNYVPFDGYPAILHRGEAVLTSAEARVWRKGGSATPAMAGGITINQYIQSVPQTPVDLANATEAYFEQARWML